MKITLGLAFLLGAFAPIEGAVPDELRLDGKVRVKGLSLEGTRVICVSENGEAFELSDGLAHFVRPLKLQSRYLFTVERAGCVTKQVVIDTHVPAAYLGTPAPFTFLFLITLHATKAGEEYEYAGPVAYVRFIPHLADFGYDTDLRIMGDPILQQELEEFQRKDQVRVLPGPTVTDTIEHRKAVMKIAAYVPEEGTLVPTMRTTAPLVVQTGTRDTKVLPLTLQRVEPGDVPIMMATAEPEVNVEHPLSVQISPVATDRIEQVLVEERSVTTIVHISNAGEEKEYRRVVHRFGAVFYFVDGHSCTQMHYLTGIGKMPVGH